uniref:BZIP domain-containing protein n=1 Tax=Globisporangium ultimum (strain ATCC 200006 / CBS 805.95 / DAOM BR144) TaxID=431595 RepID=K3W9X4_GLOUD
MKDVAMHTSPQAVMTATTRLAGVTAAASAPTGAASTLTTSVTHSAASGTNSILQHAMQDMGTPADVAAEMELLHATNRDMFSWLLFNSENMSAPGSAGGVLDDHDPFRMLGGADDPASSLPMSFLGAHSSPLTQSSTLTSTTTNTGSTTTSDLLHSHHHHSTMASNPAANGHGLATATAAAGSLQVSVQMGTNSTDKSAAAAAAAAKRRGKKRGVNESLGASTPSAGGTPTAASTPAPKKSLTGKENLNGTPMSATQEGLLRHLESANNALAQKRQASGGNASTPSVVTPPAVSSLTTPKIERASSSGSDDTLTTLQRKQKLERNRESARECRRRKREHILGVEERCRQLERENMELRGQLKAGKEAMKQEEKEKNRVCEELEQMIQRGASEKELAEKIDNFKEQYSDYGHGRRSALGYHLHQIERLLLPTQVTKMCIWALRQDDSFWQDEEDETSLPVILAKELGLTEEQKKKIQQQRGSITLICENLKNALSLLNELKTEVIQKNTTLDMEMDKLQNILTPTQRAKFIVWVTNNQACMHLLNKLWRSVL